LLRQFRYAILLGASNRAENQGSDFPEAMSIRSFVIFCCLYFCCIQVCQAGQFKISSAALERTLKARLFNTPDGRYYMRGDAHSACNLYAEDPHLSFKGDRILVRVHTGGKFGKQVAGRCLGFGVSMNTVISLAPIAEGESVGVTDARLDRISDSSEVNFILTPFLSHKLPSNIKINAATVLREILTKSTETSGYPLTLEHLDIRFAHIADRFLVVDYESDMRIE
jgi:hypothetical protein